MKIGRKPIQILFLFIIIPSISSTGIVLFLSFFELSFAQRDVNENNKNKIIFITSSENIKPFNKKVNDKVLLDFNHFGLLPTIQDVKDNRYEPSFPRNTIIPITLFPNMTSLEAARVYQNMSSLGQDRVYQNMTSLEAARVYQNMSSLGQDRVYQNMSSLGQDRVYQNMTSLEAARVYQNMSSLAP